MEKIRSPKAAYGRKDPVSGRSFVASTVVPYGLGFEAVIILNRLRTRSECNLTFYVDV